MMHKCSKCGHEFEGKFCPECGEKFVDDTLCPRCGTKHEPNVKFCPECGLRLDGKKFCVKCGAELDGAFCTQCGAGVNGKSAGNAVETVKQGFGIAGLICVLLAALMGLAFTFAAGISLEVAGRSVETNTLYYYFGNAYDDAAQMVNTLEGIFSWSFIGEAREFGIYFPVVLGTVISALGILAVVALSALTGFKAYKRYYKKEQANVIAPAAAIFLVYALLATLLLLLSSASSNMAKVAFSAPTKAGLITGGILLGLGVLFTAGSNLKAIGGAIVTNVISAAVAVTAVVIVSVVALPSGSISLGAQVTDRMSVGSFGSMQLMLLSVETDEIINKIIIYATVGGAAAIALATIAGVTIYRKLSSIGNGRKGCLGLCIASVVLSVIYLAFTIELMYAMCDVIAEEDVRLSFVVPVVILVFSVLALAAESVGVVLRKKA